MSAMIARLAAYLAGQFPDYDVDVEYTGMVLRVRRPIFLNTAGEEVKSESSRT
jgi:hypothetical protein